MRHPDNRDSFVGRVALLEQVARALHADAGRATTIALTQALSGMGGVGKTQIAIRYVYDHAPEYDAVLWVLADPPATLATEFAGLAGEFALPAATATTDVNAQVHAVRRHLESPAVGHWLLVFDNADDPDVLRDYLPTRHAGHVLITSRSRRWPKPIEVQEMKRPESIKLLLDRSGQSDADAADRLAHALGDFPLALAQAAGFLKDSGMAIDEYLALFQERRRELLETGEPPDSYKDTVFATLDLAMRRIAAPEAEELLGLIACLAPNAIPRPLLDQAFADPLRLARAIAALGKHSLIEVEAKAIEAHRLVQAVAWDRMSPAEQARHAERAVTLLKAAFPWESREVRTWDDCKALQPHADHAARLAERCRVAPEVVVDLLDCVGIFDLCRARFEDAKVRLLRTLAFKEATFGTEDPRVAITLGNLGLVAQEQGDLAEARRCQERALRIEEAAYGPDHPEVASTLTNLGIVAREQGD
ncbi:MAG TPA: FxSxx-COOH system tetratricopeptide repeat protein, partial [Isosphaeraceae bacterium]|nr:FxSxx-COOH system tetratricopeptide repeat protein [Isosphaeraceae bacterium]